LSEFEFIPTEKQIQESNIYKFMKKHKLSSLDELSLKAKDDIEWFWKSVDEDLGIVWDSPYEKILDVSKGIAWSKWFVNGKTNIYKSSVEKFIKKTPDKIAYYFESEDGGKSKITYSELDSKVSKLANGLKSLGVRKGDVIAIYLPMIEEAILSILAAAKIGAIQTIIFSGYSSDSLHVRLKDCNAKILIVSDGFHRKGKTISQKQSIEIALNDTLVEKTIIIPYTKVGTNMLNQKILFFMIILYLLKM
jgi:acetyl-CoA synthetase